MLIKEISLYNPENYIYRNSKEEFDKHYKKTFCNDYKNFLKWWLEYFVVNKNFNLIDYKIIKKGGVKNEAKKSASILV